MKTETELPTDPEVAPFSWHVYILECRDGTLYTGIARHLDKRIRAHNSGKGARYTSMRTPVRLVYSETAQSRSDASKREYAIKQLSRAEKLHLISNG